MAGNKSIYDTAMKRSHEYAWANQWERAMKEYGRALSEFPNDRTAQRNMAQCMFRLRQWPQALSAYEHLLSADATDAFALNRLAEIYLALGQQDNAQTAYSRLADPSGRPTSSVDTQALFHAEPEPPEATALARQASQASEQGNYSQALELYDQAVRAGAKQPAVFYSAGVLNQQMGRSESAI